MKARLATRIAIWWAAIWVVPSWHDAPDPDALILELDPGLAFGTGSHPTTRLCLRWLDENVRGGETLHAVALPERLLLVMGAEQTGVDPFLADAATLRLAIPGTGAVESLNVASATSVFLAEWWRQQRA